ALALTWTPTLSHYLLRRRRSGQPAEAADPAGHAAPTGFMARVTRGYEHALKFVLAYPLVFGIACIVLIAGSYFSYQALGSDLLPEMDEGGFILDYLMPAGSALADTNEVLLGVEKI